MSRTFPPGATLLELLVVLALLALVAGAATPAVGRGLDRLAVRAARDELAAGLRATRLAARAHGGAVLVLEATPARFTVRSAAGDTLRVVMLGERHGVGVDAGGPVVHLTYDGLGIGRMASRTIRVRRVDEEAGLTVSAYGRVRRWQ